MSTGSFTGIVAAFLATLLPIFPRSAVLAQNSGWQVVITLPETQASHGVANGVGIDPRNTGWGYTVDTASGRLVKFNTAGSILASWAIQKARAHRARLAVNSNGNIWVADGSNDVWEYSPQGRLLTHWTGFGGLRAIAVDRHDNTYLAQYQSHSVVERSPMGATLHHWNSQTLWHGQNAGYATGVAVSRTSGVYISTTCLVNVSCARRLGYLAGNRPDQWTDALFPLVNQMSGGDGVAIVGLERTIYGVPEAPRDQCNNRFVMLQELSTDKAGRLFVAGILWPRTQSQPFLAVGLGPGEPGCSHDGIGASWTTWPVPATNPGGSDAVHGLAVDATGSIYIAQRNRILRRSGAVTESGK